VVYARLLLPDGKDYGIHSFLVQIRSLEDHTVRAGRGCVAYVTYGT
jgi:hypothetical protein